jgi:hypothetical protein
MSFDDKFSHLLSITYLLKEYDPVISKDEDDDIYIAYNIKNDIAIIYFTLMTRETYKGYIMFQNKTIQHDFTNENFINIINHIK